MNQRPRGRPTRLTPLMMDKICFLAAHGLSNEKIAYVLDVHEDLFRKWTHHEIFAGVLKKAREEPLDQVERSLFLRATKMRLTERRVSTNQEGKRREEVIERETPPDVGACISILANKRPNEWKRNPDNAVQIGGVD